MNEKRYIVLNAGELMNYGMVVLWDTAKEEWPMVFDYEKLGLKKTLDDPDMPMHTAIFDAFQSIADSLNANQEEGKVRTSLCSSNGYREHPDIEIPEWLRGDGWTDISYRNDACGASELVLADGRYLRIWVNYPDPNERECGDRYCLYVTDDNDDEITIYEGESDTEAQAAVARILETAPKA